MAEPTSVTRIRLPNTLLAALQREAADRGITLVDLIRICVAEHFAAVPALSCAQAPIVAVSAPKAPSEVASEVPEISPEASPEVRLAPVGGSDFSDFYEGLVKGICVQIAKDDEARHEADLKRQAGLDAALEQRRLAKDIMAEKGAEIAAAAARLRASQEAEDPTACDRKKATSYAS